MKLHISSDTIGTNSWFRKRTLEYLTYLGNRTWDFSDSCLLWTPESMQEYQKAQQTSNQYGQLITNTEIVYLQSITQQLISRLPSCINYIDLGPGTEHKEDYFLEEMRKAGKNVIYMPVDICDYALNRATRHVQNQGFKVMPIHDTFEAVSNNLPDNRQYNFTSLGGLTFGNYPLETGIEMLKKYAKSGGVFINTMPRERIANLEELRKSYFDLQEMYAKKLQLLDLQLSDTTSLEITDEIKAYYTVNNPSLIMRQRGFKSGDKLMIFQSLRYDSQELLKRLDQEFRVDSFDTNSEYLGYLLTPKRV